MNPCPTKNANKSKELLTSFSNPDPVSPPKSSGAPAQPVVFDLFFNIAKYVFHFGLIIYYTTCCGGSITKADYIEKGRLRLATEPPPIRRRRTEKT
jgi:hypothetical protein